MFFSLELPQAECISLLWIFRLLYRKKVTFYNNTSFKHKVSYKISSCTHSCFIVATSKSSCYKVLFYTSDHQQNNIHFKYTCICTNTVYIEYATISIYGQNPACSAMNYWNAPLFSILSLLIPFLLQTLKLAAFSYCFDSAWFFLPNFIFYMKYKILVLSLTDCV